MGPQNPVEQTTCLHVLLKGQASGGEHDVADEFVEEFAINSLDTIHLPILQFKFKNLDVLKDALNRCLSSTNEKTGLIITSPRVVESIRLALDDQETGLVATVLDPHMVFAVGPKTARECEERLNLKCHPQSLTSANSADLAMIIKESCAPRQRPIRLIYPKSSLADCIIEDALESLENVRMSVITVYDTKTRSDLGSALVDKISDHLMHIKSGPHENLSINLIFFSPSGVEGFSRLDQQELTASLRRRIESKKSICIAWRHSCIGKTTEAALRANGLEVLCVADRPNARSLVEAVVRIPNLECDPRE